MPFIARISTITSLHLHACIPAAVTDAAFIAGLGEMPRLRHLALDMGTLSSVTADPSSWGDVQALAQSFMQLTSLHTLALSGGLKPATASSFAQGLSCLVQLTKLLLNGLFTGGDVMQPVVFKDMHTMSQLQSLSVQALALDAASATAHAEAVLSPSMRGLQKSPVESCVFQPGACAAFADSARVLQHDAVHEINWSYSELSDTAITDLARGLSSFTNLSLCSLHGLSLGETSSRFEEVQETLARMPKLSQPEMVDNRSDHEWDERSFNAVAQLITSCPRLRQVRLSDWNMRVYARTLKALKAVRAVLSSSQDPCRCVELREAIRHFLQTCARASRRFGCLGAGVAIGMMILL